MTGTNGESVATRLEADARRVRVAGAELRYIRRGTGRHLLLLHTLRTQLDYFVPLLDRLDTQRFDVIAVDLPGHGRSSAPHVEYAADYFIGAVHEFLEVSDLRDVIVTGDSIGACIGLGLAARGNPRVARVIAVNPYDYGRWGGIRRSSMLADVVFTAILWPGIGPIVAHAETRGILRRVLEGGVHDRRVLSPLFVTEVFRCGSLSGHPRAIRSLSRNWRTWIAARELYPRIEVPVTLVYGDDDWSRLDERQANATAMPTARIVTLENCGHFASLEKPDALVSLIDEPA